MNFPKADIIRGVTDEEIYEINSMTRATQQTGNSAATLINPITFAENGSDGDTRLHYLCRRGDVSSELLTIILDVCPDAAKVKDFDGTTPLHFLCLREDVSLDVVMVLLNAYPEAAREKDLYDETPLNYICCNENASLEIFHKVLDEWLRVKENRSSHSINSLIIDMEDGDGMGNIIRGDVKEFLCHLSSLFEEDQNNPPPCAIMAHFVNDRWWNGVWLVMNRHPSIVKTMRLQTTIMADFLFTAAKHVSLTTMMELIQNEPDLLEHV